MTRYVIPAALALALTRPASGQLYLINASFEGEPQDATVPTGWFACAPGTTPDILPGPWGVFTEPSDGDTYVGLITREDGTWESIGQRLRAALRAGTCYTFSVDLAHSRTYAGYNQPVRLRVWGGQRRCGRDQLLLETPFIEHGDWMTYPATFTPRRDLHYLLIEAWYRDGVYSHRGNVLIDNISAIRTCVRASR